MDAGAAGHVESGGARGETGRNKPGAEYMPGQHHMPQEVDPLGESALVLFKLRLPPRYYRQKDRMLLGCKKTSGPPALGNHDAATNPEEPLLAPRLRGNKATSNRQYLFYQKLKLVVSEQIMI